MKRIFTLSFIPALIALSLILAYVATKPVAAEAAAPGNSSASILLQEGFDAGAIPADWTIENSNADSETWVHNTAKAQTGAGSARVSWNAVDTTVAMDDWLFSPAVTLTMGAQYKLTFYYSVASATFPENLAVSIGDGAASVSMTTSLIDLPGITNTAWLSAEIPFTPSANGTHHIGFHGYSAPDQFRLYVDTITLEAVPTCFATPNDGTNVFSGVDAIAIEAAILLASAGDTIKTAGVCTGVIDGSSPAAALTISKDITILGGYDKDDWTTADDPNTIIDAAGLGRGVHVDENVDATLSRVTIQNGDASGLGGSIFGDSGGGLFADGNSTVVLTGTVIQDNAANVGGGVYHGGSAEIHFSQIHSNTAGSGGGIFTSGTLTVSRSSITDNSASRGGGHFIFGAPGSIVIDRSSYNNNVASRSGGAIFIDATNAPVRIADSEILGASQFNNNSADNSGGAIFTRGGAVTVGNIVADENSANTGGVIYAERRTVRGGSALQISGGRYFSNTATIGAGIAISNTFITVADTQLIANRLNDFGSGGGIHNDGGSFVIADGVLISGTVSAGSNAGGGITNRPGSTLELSNSTVSNHSLSGFGAGINNGGDLTIADSTITRNSNGGTQGGGLLNFGTADIRDSDFSFNSGREGGAIHNRGTLDLDSVRIRNNSSTSVGGGAILNTGSGVMTLLNSWIHNNDTSIGLPGGAIMNTAVATVTGTTISDNAVEFSDQGGAGIFNSGMLTLDNSTVSGNFATSSPGGGITNAGALTLLNSTLANNTADGDGSGLYNSDTFRSIGGGATAIIRNTLFDNANNSDCTNASGAVDSYHSIYNASVNNCATNGVNGNQTNAGQFVAGLTVNGGLGAGVGGAIVPTHQIFAASPAVIAGELASCPSTDQRGVNRVGICDVGAYQTNRACYATQDGGVTTEFGTGSGPVNNAFFSATAGGTVHTAGVCAGVAAFADGTLQTLRIDKDMTVNGANTIGLVNGALTWDLNNNALMNWTVFDAIDSGRGVMITNSAEATIYGVHIINGDAGTVPSEVGGGIFVGSGSSLDLQFSEVRDSVAGFEGGGIYVEGELNALGARISENSSTEGAGLSVSGTATLQSTSLFNNDGARGGGIYVDGSLHMTGGSLRNNQVNSSGGGIYIDTTMAVLDGVSIEGNTSNQEGGGLFVGLGSSATVDEAWIAENSAEFPPVPGRESNGVDLLGGAIHNDGTLTMTASTLISNTSQFGAGAYNDGLLTIVNSTFSANSASAFGGGIENSGFGTLNLYNSTFYANSSALSSTNGDLDVANTILAGSSGPDCDLLTDGSQTIAFRNNIIQDDGTSNDACGLTNGTDGNQIGVDPLLIVTPLTPWQPYYMVSIPFGPLSPAIDAGSNADCPATDQRGLARTDGQCDIGSWEWGAVPTAVGLDTVGAHRGAPLTMVLVVGMVLAGVTVASLTCFFGRKQPQHKCA